jgi:ATP-dependent DNA helicase RecG
MVPVVARRGVAVLEQLGLLPQAAAVQALLKDREDQWFERKGARITGRSLAEVMVAFANAEGGLIAIGIAGGAVEGASADARRVNEWRQAAADFTEPPVRHRISMLACTNNHGETDEIVLVEVEPSERVHQTRKGETFLRIGDENRRLGTFEAMELRFDKGDSVYDGTVAPGTTLDDLEPTLIARYLKAIRARSDERAALTARGLLARDGRVMRPSVAGLLVLGRHPQEDFPEAALRLLRYAGSSRETGSRMNVVRDERLDGPLSTQVDGARRRLDRWIPTATRLQPRGRFESVALIPRFAWLEAIVNAVVHRSYSITGDHVRVELFDDRLEVTSPGRLPGLVRIDNIRSTRFARNPRVARAFADLGYGRELGEGVNRMFEEMEHAGLPDPLYSQDAASVTVTFLADTLAARVLDSLPPGAERFVEHLSRTGRVTTTEAIHLFSQSRPTVLGHLHHLAETSLIEHVGTSLKDPRGYWRLRRGTG